MLYTKQNNNGLEMVNGCLMAYISLTILLIAHNEMKKFYCCE